MSDIGAWLATLGLGQFDELFRENLIDREVLTELTDADLEKLGLPLGARKKILKAITTLDESAERVPPPVAASQGERRQLTVLFADLAGSTELAAGLDPEDFGEVIRAFQDACTRGVERFEGHVAKYMGDGVLAYFGYPTAHEDDAERAVRAGLDLVAAVAGEAGDRPLACRVGIATGLVMVGELIGAGAAQEQAVVGETPNLAARLQALAAPGSVVVAPATRRLLGGLFELADLGAHRLKGFAAPVAAFRVIGVAGAESRFEALHATRPTPLVGRAEELQLLLSRWRRAQDGEGQVVLLSGEAGIGKSRLAGALLEALADEPHLRLRYQCSPHHTSSVLHPVIAQLERAAGFARGDPPATRLDKLEWLLGRGGVRVSEAAALLAPLLSIPTGTRYPPLDLTPQRRKQRTLETLLAQLEGLASERPALVVLEDAHWIDPSTLELFELVVDRAQALPALVLITSRPDFQPPWAGHPHVTFLSLNRLGQRQAAGIVARLTDGKALPAEVLAQILAKTDGVPLFVEELTKAVLESGLLRDAGDHFVLDGPLGPLAVPATLHDSLMARLDRLGPAKEIAQIGAAIGRTFSHGLLAAVAGRPDSELRPALDELVAAELAFRRGEPPEATYGFKHALVQDAAYESLLRSRRREFHARIAACLEDGFPEVVAAEPEVLAHHHGAAGHTEASFGYGFEAGRRAAERSANREAIEHLTKARAALGELPAGPARDRQELELSMVLGPALLAIEGFTAASVEAIYLRVRALCRELGDHDRDLAAIQALRTFYMVKGPLAAARALGEELLARGERDEADLDRFEGHRAHGTVDVFGGRPAAARGHLERALIFYDPDGLPSFVHQPTGHPGVIALSHLSTALGLLGFAEQSDRRHREALDLATRLRHPFSLAQALGISCIRNLLLRRVDDTGPPAETLLAVSLEQGFEFWRALALATLGWVRALHGDPETGVAGLRQGAAAAETMGTTLLEVQLLGPLAEALGRTGETREALALLAKQRRLADDSGLAICDPAVRRVEGELRLRQAEPEAAETCFQDALRIARRQEARTLELHAAMALARLWRDQGRRAEARDLLAPVYGGFTEGFDTPDLIEANALLEELQ